MQTRAWGFVAAFMALMPPAAVADSVCGPGKHLASNAWACLPGDRGSGRVITDNGAGVRAQAAAGLAVGGLVLSLVEALASGTRITDDAGPAPSRHENRPLTREQLKAWHGTQSREFNRQGIALQRAGDYDGARKAFNKAADEATEAGNDDDMRANMINAYIADALHWLHAGYQAEKAGKLTRANVSYKQGISAASLAEREDLAERLRQANDRLVKSNKGGTRLIQNDEDCDVVNGEYACRQN